VSLVGKTAQFDAIDDSPQNLLFVAFGDTGPSMMAQHTRIWSVAIPILIALAVGAQSEGADKVAS
jgi:hypothetical protein